MTHGFITYNDIYDESNNNKNFYITKTFRLIKHKICTFYEMRKIDLYNPLKAVCNLMVIVLYSVFQFRYQYYLEDTLCLRKTHDPVLRVVYRFSKNVLGASTTSILVFNEKWNTVCNETKVRKKQITLLTSDAIKNFKL